MKVKDLSEATLIIDLSFLDSTMLYILMEKYNFLSVVKRQPKRLWPKNDHCSISNLLKSLVVSNKPLIDGNVKKVYLYLLVHFIGKVILKTRGLRSYQDFLHTDFEISIVSSFL